MPVDHIRYDLLTQDALRGVIRKVLADAAAKGLPGEVNEVNGTRRHAAGHGPNVSFACELRLEGMAGHHFLHNSVKFFN